MDKCRQIFQRFWSDHFESWEQGLALLQEPPQGLELYEKIKKAILHQAKLSGVPANKLSNSPLVEALEILALDSMSIRLQSQMPIDSETVDGSDCFDDEQGIAPELDDESSDDGQTKLPGFVKFMRKFEPSKDGCNIWTYVVEQRIKPSLVRRCNLKQTRKTSYIDPDNEPPERTTVRTSDLSMHDHHKETLINDALAGLVPLDQAIFLMTYWSFLTPDERNRYRPAIIATAVANCMKRNRAENCGFSVESLTQSRQDAFAAAETTLHDSELNKRVEATELQLRISYHFVAAEDAERCKTEKARGFLAQHKDPLINLDTKPRGDIKRTASQPIRNASPQDNLRRICHLAVDCSSQDEFNSQFHSIHPMDTVYHYKEKQGVQKIRDQGLWFLMWFGRFCQKQRYHLSAYQSLDKILDSMKPVIGFSDNQIGEILDKTANNIRQRRHRFRQQHINHLAPFENLPPGNADAPPVSLTETICTDYEG